MSTRMRFHVPTHASDVHMHIFATRSAHGMHIVAATRSQVLLPQILLMGRRLGGNGEPRLVLVESGELALSQNEASLEVSGARTAYLPPPSACQCGHRAPLR